MFKAYLVVILNTRDGSFSARIYSEFPLSMYHGTNDYQLKILEASGRSHEEARRDVVLKFQELVRKISLSR